MLVSVVINLEGDSMRPLIRRKRDYVTLVPAMRPLKRGDIVLFARVDGSFVLHRVCRMKDSQVQTLGDGCWEPDGWMPADRVLGLAVRLKREGRLFVLDSWFCRLLGIGWMALLPLRRGLRRGVNGFRKWLAEAQCK